MRIALAGLALAFSTNAVAGPCTGQHLITYEDYAGYSMAGIAMVNLGGTATDYINDGAGYAAAAAGADILAVESGNWYPGASVEGALQAHINAQGSVLVGHWSFGQDPAYASMLGLTPTDYYVPLTHTDGSGSLNPLAGFGGTLAATPDLIFGVNGSTFTGGTAEATSSSGVTMVSVDPPASGTSRAIANGWLTFDYQSSDADGDGKLDAVEILEAELTWLCGGGGSGPAIALGGSCPSAVTVAATGFTPGGTVAIVKSNGTGSFAVPSGACAGTPTGLSASGVGLVTTVTANPSGAINFAGSVGSALCSKYFVFVDMATCTPSNVDTF